MHDCKGHKLIFETRVSCLQVTVGHMTFLFFRVQISEKYFWSLCRSSFFFNSMDCKLNAFIDVFSIEAISSIPINRNLLIFTIVFQFEGSWACKIVREVVYRSLRPGCISMTVERDSRQKGLFRAHRFWCLLPKSLWGIYYWFKLSRNWIVKDWEWISGWLLVYGLVDMIVAFISTVEMKTSRLNL